MARPFNIFLNYLFLQIKTVQLNMYADDGQLYTSDTDPTTNIYYPYETSRSVYSLLQICWHICSRSADNLQIIYRFSAECLQNVCRISAEYLQNVCRASAAMICNKSANLQTLYRRNQPIMLNKNPTKCTNQTTFI